MSVLQIHARDLDRLDHIMKLAREFVEDREEATDTIWYCDGDKGRELLKALGIPYIPKD